MDPFWLFLLTATALGLAIAVTPADNPITRLVDRFLLKPPGDE